MTTPLENRTTMTTKAHVWIAIAGFAVAAGIALFLGRANESNGTPDNYGFLRSALHFSAVTSNYKVVVRDTFDYNPRGIGNRQKVELIGVFPGHARAGFILDSFTERDVSIAGPENAREIEIWMPHATILSVVTDTPQKWPEIDESRSVTTRQVDSLWTVMESIAVDSVRAKAESLELTVMAESTVVALCRAWGEYAGYSHTTVHFRDY